MPLTLNMDSDTVTLTQFTMLCGSSAFMIENIIYYTSYLLAFLMTVVVGVFCLVLPCLIDDNLSQNITIFEFKAVFVCDESFSFRIRWETIRWTLALIFGFSKKRKSRLTNGMADRWVTVQQQTDRHLQSWYIHRYYVNQLSESLLTRDWLPRLVNDMKLLLILTKWCFCKFYSFTICWTWVVSHNRTSDSGFRLIPIWDPPSS